MTEQKFESRFHKNYVGGEGEVVEVPKAALPEVSMLPEEYEAVLKQYRKYVNDPTAELPESVLAELRLNGTI